MSTTEIIARFEQLFHWAPGMFLILDLDFTIAGANEAFTRATMVRREAIIGKSIFDVFPVNHHDSKGDVGGRLRTSLERVLETRAPDKMAITRHDLRIPSSEEGEGFVVRYWDPLNYPILDDEGRVILIVHQSQDVSDRILAQRREAERAAALAEANGLYQAMYDQGLFAGRLDLDGNLVDSNRSFLEVCGFRREDVIGRPFWECGWWNRSPEVQDWVKAAFDRAVRGESFRGESPYFWADGTERLVEYACMPITDEAGSVLFVFATGMDVTEQSGVVQDQRATSILESITDAFFSVGRDWRFLYVNKQAERILGRRPGDLIGKVIWEVYPGLAGSEFERAYLRAASEGVSSTITTFYPDHGRWYEVHTYPSPEGISIYFRDVSERAKAEKDRQGLADQLRLALDSARLGSWHLDPSTGELITDPRFRSIFGVDGDVLAYEPALDLIHPEDRPAVLGAIAAAMRPVDPEPFAVEYRIVLPDGTVRWATSTGRSNWISGWHEKRPVSLDGTIADITERKRAELELVRLTAESQRQRRVYEAALSNTPDLVYVFDLDHRFTYANEALLTMWGRTREQAFGRNCLELGYEPWHAAMHDREIEQVIATRQPIRGEVPFTGTHGRRIYEYIFAPVLGADGEVVAVAGTTRDVTDRQRAEQAIREQSEQLRQNDRRKDEFLAMLAHELRNPLSAVGNAVTVLKLSNDPDNLSFARDVMERQVGQLSRLIDDLLDVSRISSGKIRLRRDYVDAGSILNQAVESVRPMLRARKHELIRNFQEGTLPLRADATRVEQIVVNLLTNAAKYTPNGGLIRLTGNLEGDRVVIRVQDNGMGIPPEKLPEMFQLFAQGERSIARSEGGLGIGLTIVQKLAEMHGGGVTAMSEGLGHGSTFTVHIPAASRVEMADAGTASYQARPKKGSRILVVDDNEDTARGMARLLKLLGNEVEVVGDGPAAIEAARRLRPEFILLDIGLPGMDGYQVAAVLREDDWCRQSLIIAVSGYGQEEDKRRSAAAGFDHHLVKPVDFDSLVSLIGKSA